jgi:hypothetical protein
MSYLLNSYSFDRYKTSSATSASACAKLLFRSRLATASSESFRPGDVLTSVNGKTSDIENTDAEQGQLI